MALAILSVLSITAIILKAKEIRAISGIILFRGRIDHYESLSELERGVALPSNSPLLNLIDRAQSLREELFALQKTQRIPNLGIRPAELQALELSLEREIDAISEVLERRLNLLKVTAAVAPLLGLLGTVVGVLITFRGIAEAGNPSLSAVAPGVSEALLTTVAGLCVAIPAVMGHGWATSRISTMVRRMRQFGADLVTILAREMRT